MLTTTESNSNIINSNGIGSRVKVGIRIRPLLPFEIESGSDSIVTATGSSTTYSSFGSLGSCGGGLGGHLPAYNKISIAIPARQNIFEYDWVFGCKSGNREIYEKSCRPLITSFFKGYNATILAYGQTGSGKTYTMGNGIQSSDGVITYTVTDLFDQVELYKQSNAKAKVTLEMSYMEIYKEDCYDLFSTERAKLDIRETNKGDLHVENMTRKLVTSVQEVMTNLEYVQKLRSTASTAMNNQSSRSHAICSFYIRLEGAVDGVGDSAKNSVSKIISSKLHLVDLAGSERAKKTMASGAVFQEGVSINKGLLALGNVIAALSNEDDKKSFVPYRDSKLTRLLKDSLGGNSVTTMIVCVSPADSNVEETMNTLRFASRAMNIVNNAEANTEFTANSDIDSAALIEELAFLRSEVVELRASKSSASQNAGDSDKMKGLQQSLIQFSSYLRSILVKCLEEDVGLDDSEINILKQSIQQTRLTLFQSSDSEKKIDMAFLPPVMTLIDDLEEFQNLLKSTASTAAEGSESVMEVDEDELSHTSSSFEHEDCYLDSGDCDNEMTEKTAAIKEMSKKTEECKATIVKLREEVDRLQKENQTASSKYEASCGKGNNDQSNKFKVELAKKTKLLEEKQAELRKKEIEYARILQQKEKCLKEVAKLKSELENVKIGKVKIQKQMREEAVKHEEERKKFQLHENQMRKREQQAKEKEIQVVQQSLQKEKAWGVKLAEKELEIKKLKELTNKQDKVKQERERMSKLKTQMNIPRKGPLHKISEELSESKVLELQEWIDKEIESQTKRNKLTEEIQQQMDQRTAESKKLMTLKKSRENEVSAISIRNEDDIDRDLEIKTLEEQIRNRSTAIARCQGMLADLGQVVEKRRFATITDIREAKILLNGMFQKLSQERLLGQKQYENRIAALEIELNALRSSNSLTTVPNTGTKRRRSLLGPIDHASINLTLSTLPATTAIIKKEEKVASKVESCSDIATVSLKNAVNKDMKAASTNLKGKVDALLADFEADNILDTTFDSVDELDETFYPEEEEDEEEEFKIVAKGRAIAKKSSSSKRRKKTVESDVDDNSMEITSSNSMSEHRQSSESVDSRTTLAEPEEPLSQYKVPDLKKFLADRCLPVSGKKNELIERLQSYMLNQQNKENKATGNNEMPAKENCIKTEIDPPFRPSKSTNKRALCHPNLLTIDVSDDTL